jgi:hypothetical protein
MRRNVIIWKAIIAIISFLIILPALVVFIDVFGSSLVHLPHTYWFHLPQDAWVKVLLPVLILACYQAILYSFDLRVKLKEQMTVANIVFAFLLSALCISSILCTVDLYFSRRADFIDSALFHIHAKGELAGLLLFLSIPFNLILLIVLIIYTASENIIDFKKIDNQ